MGTYIWYGFALISLILGWRPVTKIIGYSNSSIFSVFGAFHFALRIVLSIALGYILFIYYIIKFIITRIQKKEGGTIGNKYRTSRSSDGTPSNTTALTKDGNAWVCQKCNEENPLSSITCKSCGAYK